jgi:hypothetical protein
MCDDMNIALKYSLYFNRIDLIHQLLSNNIGFIQSELETLQKKALESVEKLKIPITKSRLAFGVCDPCKTKRFSHLDLFHLFRWSIKTGSSLFSSNI